MHYEVSMTICMGRIANQSKALEWLPSSQNHSIFDVFMLGAYVYIYTKYEVFISNSVARAVHRQ